MAMKLTCHHCNTVVELSEEAHGTTSQCPSCSQPIEVPGQALAPIQPANTQDQPGADSSDTVGWTILGGLVALGILIAWLGWSTFITMILWLVIVGAVLVALGLGAAANDSHNDAEKTSLWISAGGCIVLAFVAWIFMPLEEKEKGRDLKDLQASGPAGPADSIEQQRCQRTLHYWGRVYKQLEGQPVAEDRASFIKFVRDRAAQIESIPTIGVDSDAVEWALQVAGLYRDCANVAEYVDASDQESLVRSFIHGFTGNFGGAASDVSQSYSQRSDLLRKLNEKTEWVLTRQLAVVRAKLTSRYGVEFP